MKVVVMIVTVLLFVAAVLAVLRIARGPSILDRMIGTEVLISTIIAALGTEAAYRHHATTVPILVVLSLLGFVGSVSVARFGMRGTADRSGE